MTKTKGGKVHTLLPRNDGPYDDELRRNLSREKGKHDAQDELASIVHRVQA